MPPIARTCLALFISGSLAACGSGSSSSSSAGSNTNQTTPDTSVISSVTVDGAAVSPDAINTLKNGQVLTVTAPSASTFTADSLLNGVVTASNIVVRQATSTVWSVVINATPGSVTALTVKNTASNANRVLMFNIQSGYQGTWNISYSGGDTGSCTNLPVSSSGSVSGTCKSNVSGNFNVAGTVSASGAANISGTTTTGANFVGQFTPTTVTGTWSNTAAGILGSWSGNKN